MHFPEPQTLPGRNIDTPFVIVADDAFAFKPNIMKPFSGRSLSASQRVFNYRLSRARRCIENAFGIMSARFRILRTPINLDAAKTRRVTLACCALHNYLKSLNGSRYAPPTFGDQVMIDGTIIGGAWRRELPDQTMYGLEGLATRYTAESAAQVRKEFEAYLSG